MKKYFLLLVAGLLLSPQLLYPPLAGEAILPKALNPMGQVDPNGENAKATDQQNELIETLTNLAGKEEKIVDKKTGKMEPIKVQDLKTAIKILESDKDRKMVIKALNGLAAINQETEKQENILQKSSATITYFIEKSATVLINLIGKIGDFPEIISERMIGPEDPDYKENLYVLLLTMSISLTLALIVEIMTRRILYWFNIRRPRDFSFKKMPLHVLRTITPVILFGLVGYEAIYCSQGEDNIITERGFIIMTTIIMIRTGWLVLRVLFGHTEKAQEQPMSVHPSLEEAEQTLQSFSYQFTLTLFQITIIGIIFAEISRQLGIEPTAYDVWLKIIGFGIVSLMVIGTSRTRNLVAQAFRYDEEKTHGLTLVLSRFISFIGGYWYLLTGMSVISAYLLWIFNLDIIAWMILKSIILIVVLTALFLTSRHLIMNYIMRHENAAQRTQTVSLSSSIGYLEGSIGKGFLLVWHVLYLFILLELIGADPSELLSNPKVQPHLTEVITTILIFGIIRVLWLWVDYIAKIQLKPKKIGKRTVESSQFVKTLTPVVRSIAHWLLMFMGIILILSAFKVDYTPLLYILSFASLAIALGAQGLVKDLINGVLTIIEGNIAVGEVISVGSNTGTVETLSLRGISLRHSNGSLQSISFSDISNIINKSRDYTVVPIEVNVPYHTDVGAVHKVLLAAFADINLDPLFNKQIIEPLSISGIDRFSDNGYTITANIKVKPDPKNKFLKAFNAVLKNRLEEEDILPPPSQKVLNVNMDHDYGLVEEVGVDDEDGVENKKVRKKRE